jgi:radical SAM superfamily enzyme YgiQ (UPF0313 family)
MSDAGCIQIDFGVERGSNQALLAVKKGINLEMIKNIFNLCHQIISERLLISWLIFPMKLNKI